MTYFWRRVFTMLTVYYAYMVEYRAELILWVLSGSLPIILMGVWNQAAQEGSFELSALEFTQYFLAVFLVRQFSIVWVIWDFEEEVVQGQLSARLLQPIDPVWHHLMSHIGERWARLPFVFILVGIFFLLYPQAFWIPTLMQWILAFLSVCLAFALRFWIQYTFALAAFWTERAAALEQAWFLIYIFLSGLVAPLEVFPPTLRALVMWTPFPYLLNIPANFLVGIDVNRVQAFSVPMGWFILCLLINRWLWREGLKRYSAMGA